MPREGKRAIWNHHTKAQSSPKITDLSKIVYLIKMFSYITMMDQLNQFREERLLLFRKSFSRHFCVCSGSWAMTYRLFFSVRRTPLWQFLTNNIRITRRAGVTLKDDNAFSVAFWAITWSQLNCAGTEYPKRQVRHWPSLSIFIWKWNPCSLCFIITVKAKFISVTKCHIRFNFLGSGKTRQGSSFVLFTTLLHYKKK